MSRITWIVALACLNGCSPEPTPPDPPTAEAPIPLPTTEAHLRERVQAAVAANCRPGDAPRLIGDDAAFDSEDDRDAISFFVRHRSTDDEEPGPTISLDDLHPDTVRRVMYWWKPGFPSKDFHGLSMPVVGIAWMADGSARWFAGQIWLP